MVARFLPASQKQSALFLDEKNRVCYNKKNLQKDVGVLPMENKTEERYFLMCERTWIYHLLIVVAGFFGAYTYLLRGNVFCNAQTGNVVLMGMALGSAKWGEALYYLIPISAYLMGALISELVPNPIKRHLPMRWDTLLIGI